MKLTPEQRTAALATFSEYFVRNYPGPHTIIGDPNWHAPKIFRAALHAIESESLLQAGTAPDEDGAGAPRPAASQSAKACVK